MGSLASPWSLLAIGSRGLGSGRLADRVGVDFDAERELGVDVVVGVRGGDGTPLSVNTRGGKGGIGESDPLLSSSSSSPLLAVAHHRDSALRKQVG